MTRYLSIAVLTVNCFAAVKPGSEKDPPSQHIVEEKRTESVSFPSGGVIHLVNSIGDLNIEGSDNSDIEITTIKSTADLYADSDAAGVKAEMQKVTLKTERRGNEVVITTSIPRRSGFDRFHIPAYPMLGRGPKARFNLEYRISVPRTAKLLIDHATGAVSVDNVTGDIEARVKDGEIMLHLAGNTKYNIDAKATYGNVNSDFPGEMHRHWIGQKAFATGAQAEGPVRAQSNEPGATQNLKLRVGYGDIVLLAIQTPKYPDSLPDKPATAGRGGL